MDFRKPIDDLVALLELDINVAVFDPVLFVFLNKPRNCVKIVTAPRTPHSKPRFDA
nr:IS66 family insertion sequence element accessory protein TnpB [Pseudomonas fluorescens]